MNSKKKKKAETKSNQQKISYTEAIVFFTVFVAVVCSAAIEKWGALHSFTDRVFNDSLGGSRPDSVRRHITATQLFFFSASARSFSDWSLKQY